MPSDTGPLTLPPGSQKETEAEGRGNRNSGSQPLDPCELNVHTEGTHTLKEPERVEQRWAQSQREMAEEDKES